MFRCVNRHEFSEAESRGKIIKEGLPYLICPFCGDDVPLDLMGNIMQSIQNHERRLDEITEKLGSYVSTLMNKFNES